MNVSVSFDQNTAVYGAQRLVFQEYRRRSAGGLYLPEPGCISFCEVCAVRSKCGATVLSSACVERKDAKNGYWKEAP